jgi:D-3-phosphoglycerate dehydrogenase
LAKQNVLLTAWMIKQDDPSLQRLREAGCEIHTDYWHGGRTEQEMIELVRGMDAAIVSTDPFTPQVIAAADRLKVISRTGIGYDAVDVPAATERGIYVATAPGVNETAVADFAFSLILALSRKVVDNDRNVRQGDWTRIAGNDPTEKTMGIVGLGTIGKKVARRARGFDMRVLAYDVFQDAEFAAANQVTYVPLEQLLAESDYVSLHTPLIPATRHLINEERLALMKPTAYIVNTSRGGVIDEEALYRALKSGKLAGAGLDVFEKEPPWGNPLLDMPNVLVSPHVAGNSQEAQQKVIAMACENALRVLQGQPPLHAVNPNAANVSR